MGVEIPEANKVDATSPAQTSEPELMDTNKSIPVDKPTEESGGKKDVEPAEISKLPSNAVDEWPAAPQLHSFYFVKYRSYEDPNLKKKIDIVDKEIQKRSQARSEIAEALRTKRSARAVIIDQLKPLNDENRRYKEILGEKRKEREPLQASLDEIRNVVNSGKTAVSSKEELDDLIKSLHYRLNHESISLGEEKRLIKEIKVLEDARGKMITNAPMMAKQDAIKDKVKLIGADMDGVRKEQQEVWAKIVRLQEQLKPISDEITSLEEELKSVTEKRDKAFESLLELKKSRDEGNSSYYKNRSLLNNAREVAAKKDIAKLGDLSVAEIEAFMSKWNTSKVTRDDYEKRILSSLDSRQLSKDGRMRNPDEKPILAQASQPSEVETAPPVKANVKQSKGDAKSGAQHDTLSVNKAELKVSSDSVVEKKEKEAAVAEIAPAEKPTREVSKSKEIDTAKLKEMKREEEIAKAKLAMERKKRTAEKAAAKAAVRAQKDAEKKLKEKEKKAKKKVGTSSTDAPNEPAEMDIKAVEDDATAAEDADITAPIRPKEPKEKIRYRNTSKSQNQIPKAIIKRKKSQSYWYWAAAGTSLALLLVALVWNFSFARN